MTTPLPKGTKVEIKIGDKIRGTGTIVSAIDIVAGKPERYEYKILLDQEASLPPERDMFDWSPDLYAYVYEDEITVR